VNNGVKDGTRRIERVLCRRARTARVGFGRARVGFSVTLLALTLMCLVVTSGCQTLSMPSVRGQSPAWDQPARKEPVGGSNRRARHIDDEPLPDEEQVPAGLDEGLPLSDDDPDALTDPIVDIVIEGNDTIETAAIRKLIRSPVGRPAAEQQIREDVRALYSTRWFFSVEPRYRRADAGLVLVFRVIERPMVEKVEYRGNERIATKFLEKLTGLREQSPYDVSVNREAARRIEEHYHEKGFPYVKVKLLTGDRRDEREVVFEIHEGPKVIVGSVKFTGNDAFNGSLLKTKLAMKPAFLGLPFLSKYKPERVPDDVAALKQYYHSLGYFDVKIEKEVDINENPLNPLSFKAAHAIITYHITEGPRFQIRNLVIEGNKIYSDDELANSLKLRSGDFYNARWMNKDVEEMKGRYGKLGRTFANVEPIPRFLDEAGQMDLVYQVNEDRVYTIGKINVHIQGDYPHTKESVVRNRLLLHPGDLADPKKIQGSTRRLEGQIFARTGPEAPRVQLTKVEPQRRPESPKISQTANTIRGQDSDRQNESSSFLLAQSDPATAPFGGAATDPLMFEPPPGILQPDFFATETQTGRLSFGVGVNSNSGPVGSIVLEENNFDILRPPTSWQDILNGTAWRGGGQQFRLEAVPGTEVSRYLASWTDPYFLDSDYSVGVSGFFFNRFYQDWKEDRLGGRVNVGKQLTQEVSLIGAVRLENVDISRPHVPTPALLTAALGTSFLSTGRVGIAHDTRDSQFLPSEGHYLLAGVEQAFGDFNYSRADAEAHQYFTVYSRPDGGGRHVLSLGVQAAWTGNDTPIFERYFAGGFQSFRGFSYRGVSPIDAPTGVRVGGQWMFLGGAEYKIPLTADEMIAAVAFTDFGTVEDRDVSFDHFRLTAGAGLRITIPMMGPAPIALDWGVPLIKESFDSTRMFSFSVGFTR
jgi:outer membrane protein insertion porin family